MQQLGSVGVIHHRQRSKIAVHPAAFCRYCEHLQNMALGVCATNNNRQKRYREEVEFAKFQREKLWGGDYKHSDNSPPCGNRLHHQTRIMGTVNTKKTCGNERPRGLHARKTFQRVTHRGKERIYYLQRTESIQNLPLVLQAIDVCVHKSKIIFAERPIPNCWIIRCGWEY